MEGHERREILRQFAVQVTLWTHNHELRFTIDWAFDLGDDWWRLGVEKEAPS